MVRGPFEQCPLYVHANPMRFVSPTPRHRDLFADLSPIDGTDDSAELVL